MQIFCLPRKLKIFVSSRYSCENNELFLRVIKSVERVCFRVWCEPSIRLVNPTVLQAALLVWSLAIEKQCYHVWTWKCCLRCIRNMNLSWSLCVGAFFLAHFLFLLQNVMYVFTRAAFLTAPMFKHSKFCMTVLLIICPLWSATLVCVMRVSGPHTPDICFFLTPSLYHTCLKKV